ncbi:HsdM family class I SAM-dependent methyltransferase, partial [Bifidobacterium olomucense]
MSGIELLELTSRVCDALCIEDVGVLPERLRGIVEDYDLEALNRLRDSMPDLESDWLRKVWQYHFADRKNLGQDYTPDCLGDLCAYLTDGAKSVLDLCAGSGSLTVRKHLQDPSCRFVCWELDNDVIPLLLANLAVRNIDAVVIKGDALSNARDRVWRLDPDIGGGVSRVREVAPNHIDLDLLHCDATVSNPPYNIRWKQPDMAPMWPQYAGFDVPPESNANLAFVLTAMNLTNRGVFLLPNSVLNTGGREQAIMGQIIGENWLQSAVSLPERMFEATNIPVCLMVFDRNRRTRDIMLADASGHCHEEERLQRGQHGSRSHTGRVYRKKVNVLALDDIERIIGAVNGSQTEGFSVKARPERIIENGMQLNAKRYLHVKHEEPKHRDYMDIIADLNKVAARRNELRLTVNESTARMLGADLLMADQTDSNLNIATIERNLKAILGDKATLRHDDYIAYSKNKNEIRFENNSKTTISPIIR